MNDKCFEIGTIQAFLDGETTPELSFRLTDHTAACDSSALSLAEAEEENSQVFSMLDREMNSLVPTQRLWSSITVALAEEKSQASFWDRIRSGILATFANPSITVAASVLVVFGLFAAVWSLRTPIDNDIASSNQQPQVVQQPISNPSAYVDITSGTDVVAPTTREPITVNTTKYSPEKLRKLITTADHKPNVDQPKAQYLVEEYLPGEESYVRTIADLKESVDGRKDLLMSPSTRVSFERDLAVVNDSIGKMKDVVRKNPKNQAAKQVLYSSYQNKIDLLNSVVEREELLASLQ